MTAYHGPASYHQTTQIAVSVIFLILAAAATAVRFYVRGIILKNVVLDDWLILLTLGSFAVQCIVLILIAFMELNENLQYVGPLKRLLNYTLMEFATYAMTTLLLKLSLFVFFLRIIIEKWQRRVMIVSITVFSIYTIALFFISIFQCGNPKLYLLHQIQGKCIPWSALSPINYVSGGINALTDWIFVSLPLLVIWNLNMRWRQKITCILVLLVGVIGSVMSIVRLFYVQSLHTNAQSAKISFDEAYKISITSIMEPGLGILAACLATMRPLVKNWLERTRYDRTSSTAAIKPTTDGAYASGSRGAFAAYGYELDERVQQKDQPVIVSSQELQPV